MSKSVKMPFVVSYEVSKEGGIFLDENLVAKFRCKGEAIAFAKMAFTQFPSPNLKCYRRWYVKKNKKTEYVAG